MSSLLAALPPPPRCAWFPSPARLRRAGEEVAGAYPDGQRVSTMWVASSVGTVSVTR